MIEVDWRRCKTVPRDHQMHGTRALLQRPLFMLADEVGAGKSKQVIDAAQILYEAGVIDAVVVTCPAFARGVWADPELGEIAKHGWASIPNRVTEYSVRQPNPLVDKPGQKPSLRWIVTNYEFIRREERLTPLLTSLVTRRFWLVCDEAWALKDAKTQQWKATAALRKLASRVTLLNGTPVADDPLDLFAQMKLLDPGILGIKYFTHFRARYAVLRPNVHFPMIVGWQNLEELRAKVEPYVLRRRTRDCFDLPPILDPVLIEAKLSDDTWRIYKQMRDDMVAWLDTAEASVASQAIVRGLRLAQITSGFLGGVSTYSIANEVPTSPDFRPGDQGTAELREIGREKLDALDSWLEQLKPTPERVLIWSRFRAEIERAADHLKGWKIYGDQRKDERDFAVRLLNPDVPLPAGLQTPIYVIGSPQAGGAALNLAGADLAINLSHDFNLRVFLQARGRIDRPGQRNPIRYVDVVATGPKGQRTIDHHVLAALRSKEDIATWTTATWRRKLQEE